MKNNFGTKNSFPGIVLNAPIDEVEKQISRIDIIGVDVDNCLLEGHGQIRIAVKLLPEIFMKALTRFPLGFLFTLLAGGSGLLFFKLKKMLGTEKFNLFIMRCFSETLSGVDKEAFDRAVSDFDMFLVPGAEDAILRLSEVAPVVLLSLGIDPVVKWLENRLKKYNENCCIKAYANQVSFKRYKTREVFVGYKGSPELESGKDKQKILAREAILRGAICPMIIGHDENDTEIIKWAKNQGGLTIGFAPEPRFRDMFDIVVTDPSWYVLLSFVNNLMEREATGSTRLSPLPC